MPTVRDAVVRLPADLGMTMIFGNPGWAELRDGMFYRQTTIVI